MNEAQIFDQRAIEISQIHKRSEAELLSLLMEMDRKRLFGALGFTGIYNYCLHKLGYSEDQAGYFSKVAQKSKEVPQLKQAIESGKLTLSKARRIAKVITPSTQAEWIEKAATLPQRELDRQVAGIDPSEVHDRVRPISLTKYELKAALSEKTKAKLDRVRDVSKAESLDSLLDTVFDAYLDKKDPIRKAERTRLRRVTHEVNLRDRRRCQWKGCTSTRYVELHHRIPRAVGGPDTAENLVTLCSSHHRAWHAANLSPNWKQPAPNPPSYAGSAKAYAELT